MLPRRQRLSRAGFEGVRAHTRQTTPHFAVSFAHASYPDGAGVIVSKDIARRAVDRHRLRRQLYAYARTFMRPGFFVVIRAKRGAVGLSYQAIASELDAVFGRLFKK